MTIQIQRTEDVRTNGIIVTKASGERTVAIQRKDLEAPESPVREQAATLRAAGTVLTEEVPVIVRTYAPAIIDDKLRDLVLRVVARPAQMLQKAGVAELRAIEAAKVKLLTVPPGDYSTSALRQRDREILASLSVAEQAAWVQRASVDQLDAVIEAGASRSGLPANLFEDAEHLYMKLNFIRSTGLSSDFARKPSAKEPLASGVDEAAVLRAADEAVHRHNARREIVDGVTQALHGTVTAVALICNLTIEQAFSLLLEPVPA